MLFFSLGKKGIFRLAKTALPRRRTEESSRCFFGGNALAVPCVKAEGWFWVRRKLSWGGDSYGFNARPRRAWAGQNIRGFHAGAGAETPALALSEGEAWACWVLGAGVGGPYMTCLHCHLQNMAFS